jgi:hypothetical protein
MVCTVTLGSLEGFCATVKWDARRKERRSVKCFMWVV